MHDCYASQFWPLSCVFVLWETQLLSTGVIRRIRRLVLNASYMKESQMWTLDLKVLITAFWSKGITFLKDTEYKTLITLHCVCLILFRISNTRLQPISPGSTASPKSQFSLPLLLLVYCTAYFTSRHSGHHISCITMGVAHTIIFWAMILCRVVCHSVSKKHAASILMVTKLVSSKCQSDYIHFT